MAGAKIIDSDLNPLRMQPGELLQGQLFCTIPRSVISNTGGKKYRYLIAARVVIRPDKNHHQQDGPVKY